MSALRIASIALGSIALFLMLVAAARGKCRSWAEAFVAVSGTIAVIGGVVGCWALVMYGITGKWLS